LKCFAEGVAEPQAPLILGLGGTMRWGSSSARALEIAMEAAGRLGARTRTLVGEQLDLPNFDPAVDPNAAALRLVDAVREADGLIIASPSYHGGISGLVKNALDHLELLANERGRPYLRDRAVGLIATGDGWQGPNATLGALRQSVHALQGWPTPLGVAQNINDGGVEPAREQLALVAAQVVDFALRRRS
jgi:FMN reductase